MRSNLGLSLHNYNHPLPPYPSPPCLVLASLSASLLHAPTKILYDGWLANLVEKGLVVGLKVYPEELRELSEIDMWIFKEIATSIYIDCRR